MIDKNGEKIDIDDCFTYQVNKDFKKIGRVFLCGNVKVIHWIKEDAYVAVRKFNCLPVFLEKLK